MVLASKVRVEAPPVAPAKFGLLAAANVITEPTERWVGGVVWTPDSCPDAATVVAVDCEDPPPLDTLTDGIGDDAEASAVTVYAGLVCKAFGLGDLRARAERILALGEGSAVEGEFYSELVAAAATVVGTAAMRVKHGIGELERALSSVYPGVGVFHAPRSVAEKAGPRADGPVLRTVLGTAWAFGAGYGNVSPAGVAAPAGTAWIYSTGAVVVRRSAVLVAPDEAHAFNRVTNESTFLASREYLVQVDPCARFAVNVSLED